MILAQECPTLLTFSTCRTRTAFETFQPLRKRSNHPLRWSSRRHGAERSGRGHENRARRIRRTSILVTLSYGEEMRDRRANGDPFGPNVRLHTLSSHSHYHVVRILGGVFPDDGFARPLLRGSVTPWSIFPLLWDATDSYP